MEARGSAERGERNHVLVSDRFRQLAEHGESDPILLSASKTTNWDIRLEVLGWIIDTEASDSDATAAQTMQAAYATRGVTSASGFSFREARVKGCRFPHARIFRRLSGVVFRTPCPHCSLRPVVPCPYSPP